MTDDNTDLVDSEVTCQMETIGPAEAKAILTAHPRNRTVRRGLVANYTEDMLLGEWYENGESIKFDRDGNLLDGQHRCLAIIESGTTHRMVVVRGLRPIAQDTMDTGGRRRFSDVLKIHGESRCTTVAAITRRVYFWERGVRTRGSGSGTVSTRRLQLVLDKYPDIRHSAEVADSARRSIAIPAGILGLCHWLFNRIEPNDCDWFFDRLKDGAELPADHPIAVLRKTCVQRTGATRLHETTQVAYLIKAWNAYREGRQITRLQYAPGGANPEAFPEPA